MKAKHLDKALMQFAEEGAAKVFKPTIGSGFVVGVVGALQFEVLASRIELEYGLPVRFEPSQFTSARWVSGPKDGGRGLRQRQQAAHGADNDGDPVYLTRMQWDIDRVERDYPDTGTARFCILPPHPALNPVNHPMAMVPAMMRPDHPALVLLFSPPVRPAPRWRERCSAVAPATGIDGAFSRQASSPRQGQASDDRAGVLVLRQSNRTALIAEVGQLHRSGQVRLRMDSAWPRGRGIAISPRGHAVGAILHPSRPMPRLPHGSFVLSRDAFDAALHAGFSATLIGPDDVVEIRFPHISSSRHGPGSWRQGLWPP
jgi:hypothetical protein